MDLKIYAIELENEKAFICVSPTTDPALLFQECRYMFEFVKENPPLSILGQYDMIDTLDVNIYVKQYMRYYGIDNVRGGIYTEPVLPDHLQRSLQVELDSTFENYRKNVESVHDVMDYYNARPVTDISAELERLSAQVDEYNKKKALYTQLSADKIGDIIRDIEWLKREAEEQRKTYDIKADTVEQLHRTHFTKGQSNEEKDRAAAYKAILGRMHILIRVYYDLQESTVAIDSSYFRSRMESVRNHKVEPTALVLHPQFCLDNVFLHPYSLMNWSSYLDTANILLDNIIYMAYTVLNLSDELAYDLENYPDNFDKMLEYSIRYVVDATPQSNETTAYTFADLKRPL